MNKKIFILIFVLLNLISYSEDEKIYIVGEKAEIEEKNENRLETFLNSIKYFNNTVALNYINGSKNEYSTVYPAGSYSPGFQNVMTKSEVDPIDINLKNSVGESAVILAIEYGNNVILEELLKHNVNLNVKHPVFGKYPIHSAVYFQNREAIEMLLEKDPDSVNFKNDVDGWMPLEDAVLKGDADIVKLLLDKGADPRLRDYSGKRAIDLAVNYGKGEIVKLLRDKIVELRK